MYNGNHLHGLENAEGIHVRSAIVSRAFPETSQVCSVELDGDDCLIQYSEAS